MKITEKQFNEKESSAYPIKTDIKMNLLYVQEMQHTIRRTVTATLPKCI